MGKTEEQLNAYIAAYGEMHIVKCRAALQNMPLEDFENYGFEIFDWGCGQGIASLVIIEFLQERFLLGRLQRITLIEPSSTALSRAEFWIKHAVGPGTEIRRIDKFIPQNSLDFWDDIDCKQKVSINLFSNILDIHSISLSWLAYKTASLASINYMMCIGPKFGYNTRIKDFCGYFAPTSYFSNIEQYPYAYTSRTKHPYGLETKCFIHRKNEILNKEYIEKAENISNCDDYDYAAECLRGVINDDVIECYNQIRASCGKSYNIFLRPRICTDVPDIVLASLSHGIVILNVCEDIEELGTYYQQIENIKSFLFSTHLRNIKIDSVVNKSVYDCVKTALYFPNSTELEVEEYISHLNEEYNHNRFEYMVKLYSTDNFGSKLNDLRAHSFKSDYYNELLSIIVGYWHSYKDGNRNFKLNNRQKDIVRNKNKYLRVKGVAGSGKTQIVANRAVEQHLCTGDRVLILTFNISLIQYLRMRIHQVPADFSTIMFDVTNYHSFFKSMANRYAGGASLEDYDNASFFEKSANKIEKYKTIIIDEAQDFKTSWFECIMKYFLAADGCISVFGDGEQNIYNRDIDKETKMPIIHGFSGRWNEIGEKEEERLTMRVFNPNIAALSSKFAIKFINAESQPLSIQNILTFEECYIKYWNVGTKKTAEELYKNINWIIENYKLAPADVTILGESINILRDIEQYYPTSMINFETLKQYNELKKNTENTFFHRDLEDIRRVAKTHFTTECTALKFSTIHSFKGWESKSIILLLQPEIITFEDYEGYYINEKINNSALIYTALTRAKCNLFIINLGNKKYDSFFKENIKCSL